MTFCKNCGAQLEGNEKFCVKCGTPVAANGAATPANGPTVAPAAPTAGVQTMPAPVLAAAAVPVRPPVMMQAQPVAATPYATFGPPVAVPLPQAEPMKQHHWATAVIVLALLGAGGYYYQTHQATPAAQPPGTAPTQPATAPPATQPNQGPNQPSGSPSVPGGGQGYAAQQAFAGHWQVQNGMIVISNGVWKNNASVAMQSAVLECDQFNVGKTDLAQMKINLTGSSAVPPGGTVTFSPFQMGGEVMNMASVSCEIMSVTPAS